LAVKQVAVVPTWVVHNERVYVLDAGGLSPREGRLISTDGTPEGTALVGLDTPRGLVIREADAEAAPAGVVGLGPQYYAYAFTLADKSRGVESNAQTRGTEPHGGSLLEFDGAPFAGSGGMVVRFVFDPGAIQPNERVDRIRMYRKNVTLSQPFYRLVGDVAVGSGSELITWRDPGDSNEALSSDETGPYAPSKNGVPRGASVGAVYQGRMFYNDTRQGNENLLRFSAVDVPDHVDPDDYEVLSGDEVAGVTGMAEMAGQLAVGKRRAVWILSGAILTHTNETIATGAHPPVSSHTLYRTKSKVGPATYPGPNGFIVCGHPPVVYFPSESGFYGFDGVDERMVSDAIKPTWARFAHVQALAERSDVGQNLTHAVDTLNEVLYLCLGAQTAGEPEVLAYHYGLNRGDGVGGWTTLRGDGDAILCVTRPVAEELNGQSYYSPLLVADAASRALIATDRATLPVPAFRYRTGWLPILEGRRAHLYEIKWLHGRPSPADGVPTVPVATGREVERAGAVTRLPRRLRFAVAFNGFFSDEAATIRPVGTRTFQRQPVRREVTDVSLSVADAGDPNVVWDRELALLGWALEGEPAGES
jgi:hypothetical protein